MHDEDGEPLLQTDGTGFISEDLALLVPNDFYDAKFMKDKDYEVKIVCLLGITHSLIGL